MPDLPPKGYVCYRAQRPLQIDGKLDDPSWRDAPWTDLFVDIEGDAKPRPRFRTRAKMLWDDDYFYVGAEMEEPHVWATLTEHDAVIFHDNDFEVFIDPNGDNHEYYEFEINALNTGWDLLLTKPYKDGGKPVDSWNIPGLKTAVHVDGTLNDARDTDHAWTIEMAFPWRVLGELAHRSSPPEDGDQWRVNFSRVEWEFDVIAGKYRRKPNVPENNWVWSPQGVVNMHQPETWGYVQFSTAKPGDVEFHPDPAGKAKHLLHVIYYRQQPYRKSNGRWANTLKELGLAGMEKQGPAIVSMTLETASSFFQANAEVRLPDGTTEHWHIREDSRIWREP